MICPACSHSLTSIEVSGVTVDACEGGCGGLWFDKHELAAFDEPSERADPLLSVNRDPSVVPETGKHACPRCVGIVMQRHFFSTRFEVEVDECPGCGGFWMDHQELRRVREQFDSDEDRDAANEAFLASALQPHVQTIRARQQAVEQRAGFLSRLFFWACPSALLPGKQSWGSL